MHGMKCHVIQLLWKTGGGRGGRKENSSDMTTLLFNDIKILKNTIAHQSQQS